MNILILANKPPYPAKDGSSLATLCMAEGLAKLGHRITILAIATNKHPSRIDQIPKGLKQLIDFNFVKINTNINPIKGVINLIFSRLPYNIERFIDSSYSERLDEIIRGESFDIIQLEGLYLFPYIKTIRTITDTTIVYRSHNIEHEIWERISKHENNWLKAIYFASLAKRIRNMELETSKNIDALVSISKRDEQWFRINGFCNPTIHIPIGYPTPKPRIKANLNVNSICYIGSLDWIPNQEGLNWFIDYVWPIVISNNPAAILNIGGRNASNIFTNSIKNKRGIVFHGEVEDAQKFITQHRIMIVPLHSGSGMRVKIIEGMFLKMAIISTSIGCEGIEVIDGEHILIADCPNDFVLAIEKLIKTPELIDSISNKAFTFANEYFNSNILAKRLTAFYNDLI